MLIDMDLGSCDPGDMHRRDDLASGSAMLIPAPPRLRWNSPAINRHSSVADDGAGPMDEGLFLSREPRRQLAAADLDIGKTTSLFKLCVLQWH